MKTNKAYVLEALQKILAVQEAQRQFEHVLQFIYADRLYRESLDAGNVLSTLYRQELEHWRTLFMFGLTLDKDELALVKKAAYERFLSSKASVNEYMDNPQYWLVSAEEEFRKMCEEQFIGEDK